MVRYQHVRFDYLNSPVSLVQHIGSVDFSYQINKKLYLSVNFESTFQKEEDYSLLYLNFRKKF